MARANDDMDAVGEVEACHKEKCAVDLSAARFAKASRGKHILSAPPQPEQAAEHSEAAKHHTPTRGFRNGSHFETELAEFFERAAIIDHERNTADRFSINAAERNETTGIDRQIIKIEDLSLIIDDGEVNRACCARNLELRIVERPIVG